MTGSFRPLVAPAVAFGLAAAVACSNGNSPGSLCSSPPLLSATNDSVAPVFSWTPECKVRGLQVFAVDSLDPTGASDTIRWAIQNSGGEFGPPVTYGGVPPGAVEVRPMTPLAGGHLYRVDLLVPSSSGLTLIGSVRFTTQAGTGGGGGGGGGGGPPPQ